MVSGSARADAFYKTAFVSGKEGQGYTRGQVEKQVKWLEQLATMLRSVQGRKQIVYLSEGFDARMIAGRDARDKEEALLENDAIMAGSLAKVDSDARFGSSGEMSNLSRMEHAFRGSDVVLNAIDIRGLHGVIEPDGSVGQPNDGLFLLANATGGFVMQNTNDLTSDFARLLHRQEVVYVLGFKAPPATKPNAFHPLRVKVTGSRGLTVSHRSGFYDPGAEDQNERLLSTAEIVMNDIAQDEVPLTTLAAAFPEAGGTAHVPVILDIDGGALLQSAKGDSAGAEIYVYAFGEDGGVHDRLYQRVSLDLKKVGDRARAGGIRYYGTLALTPGRYAIKALVRGANERTGFRRVEITVPRQGELALLPPIPIDEHPKAVLIKGQEWPNVYPFELNGQKFIPATAAASKVAVFVCGAGPDDLDVETKARVLGRMASATGAVLVLEVQPGNVDVSVRRKGAAEALKTTVAAK